MIVGIIGILILDKRERVLYIMRIGDSVDISEGIGNMPLFVSKAIGVLKIANGQTLGVPIKANEVFEDAVALIIYARNATDGVLTYTVQVCPDMDAASPAWYTLEDASAVAVTAPNITGKARMYSISGSNWWGAAAGMRLVSSAVTTADRFWEVTKQFLP